MLMIVRQAIATTSKGSLSRMVTCELFLNFSYFIIQYYAIDNLYTYLVLIFLHIYMY